MQQIEFIRILCYAGSIPISLVLFRLQTAGQKSWEALSLSVMTLALNTYTLISTHRFSPQAAVEILDKSQATYPFCSKGNPCAYCYNQLSFRKDWSAPAPWNSEGALIFSRIVVLVYLSYICSIHHNATIFKYFEPANRCIRQIDKIVLRLRCLAFMLGPRVYRISTSSVENQEMPRTSEGPTIKIFVALS